MTVNGQAGKTSRQARHSATNSVRGIDMEGTDSAVQKIPTDNKNFLIYKEIQKGTVAASSYMVKYLRISSHIRKPFLIYI